MTSLLIEPQAPVLLGLDPALVEEVPEGTVYLLHLNEPLWSLYRTFCWSHYIGWSRQGNLVARLEAHAKGRGARFTRMARAAGCTWHLARVWPGDPKRERQIKKQGGASRFCPSCGIWTAVERQAIRDTMGRYITPPARTP
jgi:predicted GIY-YIG superfamily endonuclease